MKNREKKRSTALFYVYENDLCQQIAFRRRVIRSSVRWKGSVLAQTCYRGFLVIRGYTKIFLKRKIHQKYRDVFDVKTGAIPNSRDFASTNIKSHRKTRYVFVDDISRNKDIIEFCVALIIYVSSATASSTRLQMHAVMHNDCIHPDTNMLCGKRLGLPFVCYKVYCV